MLHIPMFYSFCHLIHIFAGAFHLEVCPKIEA